MLMLVVGPSGAGKDTLLNAARIALADSANVRFVRREITRPLSDGGEDHLPISPATFTARRDEGEYALWWETHGLAYGIPADIATDIAAGVTVIASVSRSVIADAAKRFTVRVVEITAPIDMLAARLAARSREDAADIANRLRRQVPLPLDVETITVLNDGTVEDGMVKLLAAFSHATAGVPPG